MPPRADRGERKRIARSGDAVDDPAAELGQRAASARHDAGRASGGQQRRGEVASSAAMCCDTADCVYPSSRAAAENEARRAMATNVRTKGGSTPISIRDGKAGNDRWT
jgi:hypothetical protein